MAGLGASAGMMLAVGFAILTSMIWSKEVGCFFFLGYVLVKYMNLGTLPIAIIGAVFAITLFFAEKRTIDLKNSLAVQHVSNSEEDFF
jgi:PTS system mannose-specific IIC component/fructoselysine and glucoselysine-specific PTS system IIC component